MIRIGIDASGGDYGYPVITEGVEIALEKDMPFGMVLYTYKPSERQHPQLEVKLCKTVNQELAKAFEDMSKGEIQAIVTATNSVTLLGHAARYLMRSIHRPGLLAPCPTAKGTSYLIDVGATAKTDDPKIFLGWALAGRLYLTGQFGYENPKIGLLNIAGNRACPEIAAIKSTLEKEAFNFIGYIEPDDFFKGNIDLALCDGFTGNLILKWTESLASLILKKAVEAVGENKSALEALKGLAAKYFSYDAHLISPLVGINTGQVLRVHGATKPEQIARSLELAYERVAKPM